MKAKKYILKIFIVLTFVFATHTKADTLLQLPPEFEDFPFAVNLLQKFYIISDKESVSVDFDLSYLKSDIDLAKDKTELETNILPVGYSNLTSDFVLSNLDYEIKGKYQIIKNSPKFVLPKNQLSREKVNFEIKNHSKRYTFLGFKLSSNQADPLWLFSPFTNGLRKLSASNRDDEILGSQVSLNDLFVFQSSSKLYTTKSSSQINLSVLVNKKQSQELKEGACYVAQYPVQDRTQNNSIEVYNNSFTKFVLFSNNFNTDVGKIIVYLDKKSNLPVYKLVYDKSFEPLKAVVNIVDKIGIATKTIAVTKKSYTELAFLKHKFCKDIPSNMTLDQFDPSSL